MYKKLRKKTMLALFLGLGVGFVGCGNEDSTATGNDAHVGNGSHAGKKTDDDQEKDTKCQHGTPDPTTGKCSKCDDINWTGDNCDKCADGFSGNDCHWVKPEFGEYVDDHETFINGRKEEEIAYVTYKTIKIGKQIWYAENSIYSRWAQCQKMDKNTVRGNKKRDEAWLEEYYSEIKDVCYYSWAVAIEACDGTKGWRLPTVDDIKQLLDFADKFKTSATVDLSLIVEADAWNRYLHDSNNHAGDDFGLGLYPTGSLSGNWFSAGDASIMWTSTLDVDGSAYSFSAGYSDYSMDWALDYYDYLSLKPVDAFVFPVRCVKDAE